MREYTEISFKDGYSQRKIAKNLNTSRYGLHYSLQRPLGTGTNANRNKTWSDKSAEVKNLILEQKN